MNILDKMKSSVSSLIPNRESEKKSGKEEKTVDSLNSVSDYEPEITVPEFEFVADYASSFKTNRERLLYEEWLIIKNFCDDDSNSFYLDRPNH